MRLASWKEIAAYVGRDVRTVLRWHKDRGLPVHRAPGGQKGSVFAETEELDAWLKSGPKPAPAVAPPPPELPAAPASHRSRLPVALAGLALAGLLLVAVGLTRTPRDVASLIVSGSALMARDASGATIWTHELAMASPTLSAARPFVFADVDADGRRESVVAVRHLDEAGKPAETILCLDAAGRRKWDVTLADELAFGAGRFGPPWRAEDMTVVQTPGGPAIAVAVHHDVWWPSFVAVLDGRGRVRDRFVHAGWLTRIDPAADGRTLIAAGFSNSRDASVAMKIPVDRLTGHSAEAPGSPFACLNCADGEADRYVAFPRTEINRASGRAPVVNHLTVRHDGSIVFRAPQDPVETALEAVFELNPDFSVRRANLSDAYWSAHRRLEHEGLIAHAAAVCPERDGLRQQ